MQYAVLEADAKVNGWRQISHPTPPKTTKPIWMPFQTYHYVHPESQCKHLVWIVEAVTTLHMHEKCVSTWIFQLTHPPTPFLGDHLQNGSLYTTGPLSVLSVSVCNVGVLWPNGSMDQDETWHARRPRPWPHYVRWGPSSPPPKGNSPPNFRPISASIVTKRLNEPRCH